MHSQTSSADQTIVNLFRELIPFLFSLYDTYLPNDSPSWKSSVVRQLETEVPSYELTADGISVHLHCQGHTLAGSLTGYLSMIGGLWGIARGKVLDGKVCIRMFYAQCVSMPAGDFLIEKAIDKFLPVYVDLACQLAQSDQPAVRQEAELLVYQLMKILAPHLHPAHPKRKQIINRLEQAFSKTFIDGFTGLSFDNVSDARGTTHQAMIKALAKSSFLVSIKALERIYVLEELHGHIHDTDSNLLNVLKIFSAFLPLWNDPHPWVRDLMYETTDFLVSKLFYHQAYQQLIPELTRLIEGGVNLDINLARRSECQMVLGQESVKADFEIC